MPDNALYSHDEPPESLESILLSEQYADFKEALEVLYIEGNINGRQRFTKKWPDVAAHVLGDALIEFDDKGVLNDAQREQRENLEDEAEERRLALITLISPVLEESVHEGVLKIEYVTNIIHQVGRKIAFLIFNDEIVEKLSEQPASLPHEQAQNVNDADEGEAVIKQGQPEQDMQDSGMSDRDLDQLSEKSIGHVTQGGAPKELLPDPLLRPKKKPEVVAANTQMGPLLPEAMAQKIRTNAESIDDPVSTGLSQQSDQAQRAPIQAQPVQPPPQVTAPPQEQPFQADQDAQRLSATPQQVQSPPPSPLEPPVAQQHQGPVHEAMTFMPAKRVPAQPPSQPDQVDPTKDDKLQD